MTKCTTPRKPLSKRTRFEVFKRDGFVCQYCGRKPPEVTLECDHIHPRSQGGSDEPMNLVTACRDCNSGKAAKLLADVKPTPDAEAARLEKLQELAELKAYQDAVGDLEESRGKVVATLCDLWCDCWDTQYAPVEAIEKWLRSYGPDELHVVIEIGCRKYISVKGNYNRMCYTGAILRNRQNGRAGKTCSACANHGDGTDGRIVCYLRPAEGVEDQWYVVYPNSSCGKWEADG